MRPAKNSIWIVVYAALVFLIVLALLQVMGLFAVSTVAANIVYIFAIAILALALTHWAGLM